MRVLRVDRWYWLSWIVIALVAIAWLAVPYTCPCDSGVALDDAYITFRYAQNLAESGQFVYNLEQPEDAFATTAPAYAVVLAALKQIGIDIPWAAAVLGTLSILLAAWALGDALFRAARDSDFLWPASTGLVAGGLLAFAPLLWLVLGMEGLATLGLVLLGFWFANRRQDMAAAVLLGIAMVVRFDAAAAAAAWGLLLLYQRRWRTWKALTLSGGVALALYGIMYLLLSVPLPSTLASKQAQVALGITGFFPQASYGDGAAWIAIGYWKQSPLAMGLLAALVLIGLGRAIVALPRSLSTLRASPGPDQGQRSLGVYGYVWLLLLWVVLHLALYVVLGVTPYLWYYLPFVAALGVLAALGLTTLVGILPEQLRPIWLRPLMYGLVLVIIGSGVVRTHQSMQQQLQNYEDLPVTDPRSVVLPGAQVKSYREAGRWLAANAPEHATVGVSDVGLIGYYSQRPMIDFWGLLDSGVADALARRDLVWALYAHQPDYLALYGEAPLFGYDVFKDRWFQSAYEPVHRVSTGKVTIYRRRFARSTPTNAEGIPPDATPMSVRFGDVVELVAYRAPAASWTADIPLNITFFWRVLRQPDKNYTLFTHLRDSRGAIVASRDAAPLLGARPMSEWQPGELVADFHPLGFDPLPWAPTELSFEIGLYDKDGGRLPAFGSDGVEMPGGQAQFGRYPLLPARNAATLAARPPADDHVAIAGYDLDAEKLEPGLDTPLIVHVASCDCPVELAAELWDENGQRLAWQQERTVEAPGAVAFTVTVAEGELADWPRLRLRARKGDVPLLFTDPAGQPIQDSVPLTAVQVSKP